MAILKSLVSALSTYSKVPMPNISYKEGEGRFTLCFFPLVGVIIAGLEYLWFLFSWYFELADLAFFIGAMVVPIAVTGGIHMDGFIDCMDAIHSYKSKEERLKILEDPHVGAFAIIKLLELTGIWLIGFYLIDHRYFPIVISGFVASRILSAISIQIMKCAKETGMVVYTKKHSSEVCTPVLIVEFIALICCLIIIFHDIVVFPMVAVCLCSFIYTVKVKKTFGGITGDTAGCFLVMTETAWLLSIALYCLLETI